MTARLPCRVLLGLSLAVAAPTLAQEPAATYVVQPGESLWSIAGEVIGDPTLWPALYRANRDQIVDPHLLHPGQRLAIPSIDPATREAVRAEAPELLDR